MRSAQSIHLYGHPPWLPEKFETLALAREEAATLRRRLERDGQPFPEAFARCSSQRPCGLAVCRACIRDFRENYLHEAHGLTLEERAWTRISIVPKKMLVRPERLHEFDMSRARAAMQRKLLRLVSKHFPGRVIVGGFDVSLNTLDNLTIGYQFHLYLLIDEPDKKAVEDVFKREFKPEPSAARPYSFKRVKDGSFFKVLSYSYKATAYRRSSYSEPRRTEDGRLRKNGKSQSLSAAQSVELASWLGDARCDHRLLFVGIRREQFDSGFRLRLIADPEKVCT